MSCEFNVDEEDWLWIEEERSWVVVAEPLTPQFDLETLWKGTKSRFRIFATFFQFVLLICSNICFFVLNDKSK